ncbi:hypothetical protein [Streptomyces sp. SP17KL33]|uniref:hypothetical protein n=1 Tax=Streptomyces sp. SP17KL33 TaxID=3002534 RepID=UPI002E79DB49|nr:hypothetical protein [Streptomyces sp. SP17KL33]MEE1833079.1 hypothetical protein [Streptomyces sp. SP17KL33]
MSASENSRLEQRPALLSPRDLASLVAEGETDELSRGGVSAGRQRYASPCRAGTRRPTISYPPTVAAQYASTPFALGRYLRRDGRSGVSELQRIARELGALSVIRPAVEAVLA